MGSDCLKLWKSTVVPAVILCLAAAPYVAGETGEPLGEARERFEKVVSAENLMSVIDRTSDFQTLLGLAVLSGTRLYQVRESALQKAAYFMPQEPAQLAALTAVRAQQGEAFARALIAEDPSNALGYYLVAKDHAWSSRPLDAIEMLRKGASAEKMTLPEPALHAAILRALDVLGLQGTERFLAVSTTRVVRHVHSLSRLGPGVTVCVSDLPESERDLAAELLFAFAGHMAPHNDTVYQRWATKSALRAACRLKQAVAAAEDSPAAAAYASLIEIIGSQEESEMRAGARWSGMLEGALHDVFYPRAAITQILRGDPDVDEEAQAILEQAFEEHRRAALNLLELVCANDTALKAYLDREPLHHMDPRLSSALEDLEKKESMARETFEQKSPIFAESQTLRQVGLALLMYAMDHDGAFPERLDVLAARGYIATSDHRGALTGEGALAYVGSGMREDPRDLVAYGRWVTWDNHVNALFGDGSVRLVPFEQVEALSHR